MFFKLNNVLQKDLCRLRIKIKVDTALAHSALSTPRAYTASRCHPSKPMFSVDVIRFPSICCGTQTTLKRLLRDCAVIEHFISLKHKSIYRLKNTLSFDRVSTKVEYKTAKLQNFMYPLSQYLNNLFICYLIQRHI